MIKSKNASALKMPHFYLFMGAMSAFSFAVTQGSGLLSMLFFFALFCVAAFFFFKISISWRNERKFDLANKAIEMKPDGTSEELHEIFYKLRRKDRWKDALRYLMYAGIAAIWVALLHFAGAIPISDPIGWYFIVPGLIVAAISQVIISFLPQKKETVPELKNYLQRPEHIKKMIARKDLPDRRKTPLPIYVEEVDTMPSLDQAVSKVKNKYTSAKADKSIPFFKVTAGGFFVVLPIIVCFGMMIMAFASPDKRWAIMFAWILPLSIFPMIPVVTNSMGFKARKAQLEMLKYLKRGPAFLQLAGVLSIIPGTTGGTELEIALDPAGTIRWNGCFTSYQIVRKSKAKDAAILSADSNILAVFLLTKPIEPWNPSTAQNATAAQPANGAKEMPPEKAVTEPDPIHENVVQILGEGRIPDDSEMKELIQKRINIMDPEKKQLLLEEIREARSLMKRRYSFNDRDKLTPAEEARLGTLQMREYSSRSGDGQYRDFRGIESALMEELNLSRAEIYEMKKNPFVLPLWKTIGFVLGGIALAVGLVAVAKIFEKNRAVNLISGFASAFSGCWSLGMATKLVTAIGNARNFRKLQKAYANPEFWEDYIEVEAYNKIRN